MKHDFSNDLQESTKTFKIRSRQLKFNFCLCKWKENQRVPMANLWINYFRNENWNYRISPSNIARADYFLFRAKRGRLFEGRRLFPILFPGSRALKIYVFFFFSKEKSPQTNWRLGFSRVSNLVPWIIFRAWIVTDLAGSGTASTWQGADKRKRRYGKRGKGGRLFEGGDYFKYFRQRGAIIRGNMVTRNSSLSKNENMFSKKQTKQNDQEKSEKEIISARVEPQTFDV